MTPIAKILGPWVTKDGSNYILTGVSSWTPRDSTTNAHCLPVSKYCHTCLILNITNNAYVLTGMLNFKFNYLTLQIKKP